MDEYTSPNLSELLGLLREIRDQSKRQTDLLEMISANTRLPPVGGGSYQRP